MKSEQNKKPLFKKIFSYKYKEDDVKYKQQYSNPEFENNSVSDLSPINELDSTDPLDKPFNIEEERNKMIDGVKKWGFLKKPVVKNIYNVLYVQKLLSILKYYIFLSFLQILIILADLLLFKNSNHAKECVVQLVGYTIVILILIIRPLKASERHKYLFDEEFINESGLKIFNYSTIITKNYILYCKSNKVYLIPKEDIGKLVTSNKNFKITIMLKNNKKIKIKCTDESQRTAIENWFNTDIFLI